MKGRLAEYLWTTLVNDKMRGRTQGIRTRRPAAHDWLLAA